MVAKCLSCKNNVTRHNPGVRCFVCQNHFHTKCGDIDNELFQKLKSGEISAWKCANCRLQSSTHNPNNVSNVSIVDSDSESEISFNRKNQGHSNSIYQFSFQRE